EFPNDRILFVALNSSWAIDHINCDRAGINMNSLANSLKQLKEKKYDDWLKIAVWHHPITRQGMMEYAFMRMLAVQGFEICMHGHIHKASQGFYNFDPTRGIHIVGAGTFGAPTDETVTGILYQYNLLKCNGKANEIIVETRKKEEPDGAWKADARWGDPKQPVPIYMIPLISNHPHVPSGRKSVFHFNLGLKRLKPQAVSPCRSAASE
ncbi:MAG: hypothetical protein GY816_16335, partial [Cytophagales bacterium]|nr:hypothetical protein [Cytophagales bacterium]